MINKKVWIFVLIALIILSGVRFYLSNYKENQKEKTHSEINISDEAKKYYDWEIKLIVCKECSPYNEDDIGLSELEELRNELINKLGENEVIFEGFGIDKLYLNMTNQAKNKLNNLIKEINDDKDINLTISTVYYDRIIHQEEQKVPSNETNINYCKEDRECARVDSGCCGCTAGGKAITINEDYLNYWNNKLDENCKMIGCIAVMSNDWTCFSSPICINNRCELRLTKESICISGSMMLDICEDLKKRFPEELFKVRSEWNMSCSEIIELCE